MSQSPEPVTYAAAGVDVAAADRAVDLMKASVKATQGPAVVGGLGGFAGLYDLSSLGHYRKPYLASSTDGVGTKVAIAQALDIHHTIGQDLVGMVVDDIVVCGARPLFMTDYIATGKVVPERIADLVRGIAQGCTLANTALVGGETAEHPGLLAADEYDLAGAATGLVEADQLLGPDRVRPGDLLLAMGSSGLHSNGYSLVRQVIKQAGWSLERQVAELGRSLGEELLEPTRIYTADCLALIEAFPVNDDSGKTGKGIRCFSHVTGGGLAANLARVLPLGTLGVIDRSTWQLPAIFSLISQLGAVPQADLEGTLNLGVGMVAVLDPAAAEDALKLLTSRGLEAWILGRVEEDRGEHHTNPGYVQGAKGVQAGAAMLINNYRSS